MELAFSLPLAAKEFESGIPSNHAFGTQPFVSIPDLGSSLIFEKLEFLPSPVFETEKGFNDILSKTKKAKLEDLIPPEKIWMGIYFDKELQKGIHPRVSIRYIDSELGYGVFAEQPTTHTPGFKA